MPSEKMIPLESYTNVMLAELDRDKLAQNGIEARIFDGNMGTYYAAVGGVRLMVEEKDLETAKEILAAENPPSEVVVDEAEEITSDSVYCSRCHSRKVVIESVEVPPGFLRRLFGLKPGERKTARCRDCGNEWRG